MTEEHKRAWNAYLRTGAATALAAIETKQDSGFRAPPELDRLIEARLRNVSPMRQIASVRTTGGNVFKKPVSISGAGSAGPPTLSLLEFPAAELYANLAATQTLLDDTFVELDEWIASEVEEAFAGQERAAFIHGDGLDKPRGLLSHPIVPEREHTHGQLGYIDTDHYLSPTADSLVDLIYAPAVAFRQNARFVMNRRTLAVVRKLKDRDGDYIWEPSEAGGATVLGYPVTEIEDMPDIAPGACPIAFGDFARGYLIVDRAGVNVLRDPYSAKPYVLFYITKRVAGGVQNFDAIKLLRIAGA